MQDLAVEPNTADPIWVRELELTSFLGYKLCDMSGQSIGILAMFSQQPFSKNDETFSQNLAEIAAKAVVDIESRRQLLEAREKAEAATRAKDCFLASMSHEIRTPMTAILGFADILERDLEGTKSLPIAQTVRRNGEHLLAIMNDILDIAKIEAGKIDIETIPWSPRQVFEDSVSFLRGRAEAKGLELIYEEKGLLPDSINTDPARLRQILLNLIGNAIKFTETGSIRVVSSVNSNSDSQRDVRCDVIDTGIGIPNSLQEMIFEPFSQADQSSSRRFEGTGLGLAISRQLADALGGHLSVSSEEGKGSTFSLTIPTEAQDDRSSGNTLSTNPVESKEQKKENGRSDGKLSGRVLLAEDVPVNQLLVSAILSEAGVEVTNVPNGLEAVEHILGQMQHQEGTPSENAKPFDLVLMDMQMPILDGYEATRRLRDEGFTGPIIALTAHAMRGDREQCFEAGCDDYLTKPIDRRLLLSTVDKYVKQARNRNDMLQATQGDKR